jgi:hypothetical protein
MTKKFIRAINQVNFHTANCAAIATLTQTLAPPRKMDIIFLVSPNTQNFLLLKTRRKRMPSNKLCFRIGLFTAILFCVFCFSSFAAATPKVQRGAKTFPLVKKDVSRPLRDIAPAPRPSGVKLIRENPKLLDHTPARPDRAMQTSAAPSPNAPDLVNSFEGTGEGITGYDVVYIPPDTNGDVNGTYYVQTVNADFTVFNKSNGSVLLGPLAINTIWDGFGGGCEADNDGDPIVLYDQFSNRWIISQFAVSNLPYLECVAVSTTSDPTGSYHRYAFEFDLFPDYPKVAVWPSEDAYFITFNMFDSFFAESRVCAFRTSILISGGTSDMQCLSSPNSSLLAADLDGTTQPAGETDGYVVGRNGSTLSSWRVDIDWTNAGNSTLTGPSNVTGVAAYTNACNGGGNCIAQPKPGARLDSLGARLMHRAAYRIVGTQPSLVVNHSVTTSIPSGRKTVTSVGVRWYELRPSGSLLAVHQQGTFAPDATFRWMGSIAMDKQGNIAMGYSASSASLFPSIRFTGRLAGDALNAMQAEATITAGQASQQQHSRWGDYSSIVPDPDGCRFWYTTEYLTTKGVWNWHTRIASFKFPSCI